MKPLFILCDPEEKVSTCRTKGFQITKHRRRWDESYEVGFFMHIGESENKLKVQILNLVKVNHSKKQLPLSLIADVK